MLVKNIPIGAGRDLIVFIQAAYTNTMYFKVNRHSLSFLALCSQKYISFGIIMGTVVYNIHIEVLGRACSLAIPLGII
jgi:hypothetical protein